MAGPYFLGIDGGTESLRAAIFDSQGKALAFFASPYKTTFPQASWAEQNPEDWWQALCLAVPGVVAKAGIKASEIAAMAVDTTCCSVVALDKDKKPLRAAIIWMDVRASYEAANIMASNNTALQVNNAGKGPLSAEWFLPKVSWIKNNQPEIFDKTATFCEYQDYLNYRLTGNMVASINNASIRWHYNNKKSGFSDSFLSDIGLSALKDKLPNSVLALAEIVGKLSPNIAKELGLPANLVVAQGGADAFIGMIGLNVVRPDSLAFITGSSHLHLALSDKNMNVEGLWGSYPDSVIPGLGTLEGGQTSTGSIINWFRNFLPAEINDYGYLNNKAQKLAAGSDGLMLLEHFQGNRTPYTDANSRGVLMGLSLKHGPEHIFRAIMEGVAFGSELIFETMRGAGFMPEQVVMAGGATNSELFMQIHADVSGMALQITKESQAPALGSAILAAVGAGYYDDIVSASDAMVAIDRYIEPNLENHERYKELFAIYKEIYPAMVNLLHRQVKLT